MDRIEAGIEQAVGGLTADPEGFRTVSRSIMTTDTRPKLYSERGHVEGKEITLLGMAKGAAMIGPAHGDHARVPVDRCADLGQ